MQQHINNYLTCTNSRSTTLLGVAMHYLSTDEGDVASDFFVPRHTICLDRLLDFFFFGEVTDFSGEDICSPEVTIPSEPSSLRGESSR